MSEAHGALPISYSDSAWDTESSDVVFKAPAQKLKFWPSLKSKDVISSRNILQTLLVFSGDSWSPYLHMVRCALWSSTKVYVRIFGIRLRWEDNQFLLVFVPERSKPRQLISRFLHATQLFHRPGVKNDGEFTENTFGIVGSSKGTAPLNITPHPLAHT